MPIFYGTPGGIPSGSLADGTAVPVLAGKAGELIDAKLHGDFYTANYRGRLFMANTLAAGTTIPIQATNLVSTFTIWNPLGSGVNVELVYYSAAFEAATTVVSDVSLYLQTSVGAANVVPATLTALAVRPCFWGGASVAPVANNQASMYSAATLVNTMATNMFRGPTLFGPTAVTSTALGPVLYPFNGTMILGPGTLATTAGTAAQTSAAAQTLVWAEFPT